MFKTRNKDSWLENTIDDKDKYLANTCTVNRALCFEIGSHPKICANWIKTCSVEVCTSSIPIR